ncbi:MAG: redoxin domain-containing protein [Chthonomonadales bacterium]
MIKTKFAAPLFVGLCAVGISAMAVTADKVPDVATVGKPVKAFTLKDVMTDLKPGMKADSAMVALGKFKGKKEVVLFFMSEQCSVTWRYEKRMGKLMHDMAKKDVAFVGLRCSATDTAESIRKFAETRNFAMPVLNDDKGEVAKYFSVIQTPTFVVIDKAGVLRYRGSFDDNPEDAAAKKPYLRKAVVAVLNSKEVPVKMTKPFG